jgi:hypothetical protein
MTPDQFELLLSEIQCGTPIDVAARSIGIERTYQAYLNSHPNLLDIIDDAAAMSGANQKQARTYDDDPPINADEFREPKKRKSQKKQEDEYEEPQLADDGIPRGYGQVIEAAAAMGPGLIGVVEWIDRRCQEAGMHPSDPVWKENWAEFIESGKPELGILAGLRAGKTSTILRWVPAIALFQEHKLEAGELGIFPIISVNLKLAGNNMNELERILRAMGMVQQHSKLIVPPGGLGGEYKLTRANGGGGEIEVMSAFGVKVKIVCMAARANSVIGYTCTGGFVDEVDMMPLEGAANPASELIDLMRQRATTTLATAKIIISSAFYPSVKAKRKNREPSVHEIMMRGGPTETLHLARMTELGAQRDNAWRLKLASEAQCDNVLLTEPADPNAFSIPSWGARDDVDPIHYWNIVHKNVGALLAVYGARLESVDSGDTGMISLLRRCLTETLKANSRNSGSLTMDGKRQSRDSGLAKFPGLSAEDPRSYRHGIAKRRKTF